MDDPRRKQALKRLALIAVLLCAGSGTYWYFSTQPLAVRDIVSFGTSAEQFAVKEISQNISAPPPLRQTIQNLSRGTGTGSNFALTRAGVIAETNAQRADNGSLPPLAENATLDQVAVARINDMFAQQYFAHVGPQGESAQTVASSAGYAYLALGENLAEGNFPGDNGVVVAWMGSPGHRANILNTHYTEIGVAVKQGMFQGYKTWLAVQVFGRPASDCPGPDESLKAAIDGEEAQLSAMSADLAAKKADIDNSTPQYGPEYNQKVDAYNAEVARYNDLAAQAKAQIAQYNAEVQSYNTCINR